MKKSIYYLNLFVLLNLTFSSSLNAQFDMNEFQNISINGSANGVVPIPASVGATVTTHFDKYTKYIAPNGGAIHILGQSNVTEAMMVRARSILGFHLTDVPGSLYGANKAVVANEMADNVATLLYFNDFTSTDAVLTNLDFDANFMSFTGIQDLNATETFFEGAPEYINNSRRDASYEEILHLVQEWGIRLQLPTFWSDINIATNNAIAASTYNQDMYEYQVIGMEIYYGLWHTGYDDGNPLTLEYTLDHRTRAELLAGNPILHGLIESFHPTHFFGMTHPIDPTFNGVFKMYFDAIVPYTNKSQYVVHATLNGNNDSGLHGNDEYNRLTGNSGNNSFEGAKGHDRLNGSTGIDTAIFTGPYTDYTISNFTTYATVSDAVSNRDGVDTLWNMEYLNFSDQTVEITLEPTTEIELIKEDLGFNIYPNPSDGIITIVQEKESSIFIYNSLGKLVDFIDTPLKEITLDLRAQEAGLYFIKTSNGLVKKLTIK